MLVCCVLVVCVHLGVWVVGVCWWFVCLWWWCVLVGCVCVHVGVCVGVLVCVHVGVCVWVCVGDGQGGLACCGSQGRRVRHDLVTELN